MTNIPMATPVVDSSRREQS